MAFTTIIIDKASQHSLPRSSRSHVYKVFSLSWTCCIQFTENTKTKSEIKKKLFLTFVKGRKKENLNNKFGLKKIMKE